MLSQILQAQAIEWELGDSRSPANPFSFAQACARDELEAYPQDALSQLASYSLHEHYLPLDCDGRLADLQELFFLVKVLSRRDMTIALAHGVTFFAMLPVWIAGSAEQKRRLAAAIRAGKTAAFCLGERDHGSDLLANEMEARASGGGFVLSGEKWLINSATRGQLLVIFARTGGDSRPPRYSLFCVDKSDLEPGTFSHLPRERTLGVRGLDLSGIKFCNSPISADTLIGASGAGLEITLKALQVSRTLCAALSLGAAQTALEETLRFVLCRRLYGRPMIDIPHVRQQLIAAFLDILICDCVSMVAVRVLQACPREGMLWSSVVKYFVPVTLEGTIRRLAELMGARHYLRQVGGEPAIFQKVMRDAALVSFFDGNTATNLNAVAQYLHAQLQRPETCFALDAEALRKLFTLGAPLPALDFGALDLTATDPNTVVRAMRAPPRVAPGSRPAWLDTYSERLKTELCAIDRNMAGARAALGRKWNRSGVLFDVAARYCSLHAAASCLFVWEFNRQGLNPFFHGDHWLALALERLLPRALGRHGRRYAESADDVLGALLGLREAGKMFSVAPLVLV